MTVSDSSKTFRILSCIGILLIIMGHLNCNLLEFGGLFPYYSYHVMIFVFISGYFYKSEDENGIIAFVVRKIKRLIMPYMLLNVVFGFIVLFLHRAGFAYGGDMSIETLLISPFADGHQFGLNAPGWFITALFLLEMCNVCGRAVLRRVGLDKEMLIMGIYLMMGVAVIILSMRGMVYDYYRIPARIMLMAPFFQLGRIYKTKIEKYDTLNTVLYLIIVVGINVILHFLPYGLAYSAAWVNGFTNIVLPFVTTMTGVALWLRISRLIAGFWRDNRFWKMIDFTGSHTFYICILHLSVFLVINEILNVLNVAGFNGEEFKWNVYYSYGGNAVKLIYAVFGMIVPVTICWCCEKIKEKICG